MSHGATAPVPVAVQIKMLMRLTTVLSLSLVLLHSPLLVVYGWGIDGHFTVCRIAQPRLSDAAAAAVKQLLPEDADDLASLCSWADRVKFRYHWSSPLHYIDTPDNLCSYTYNRDCKDETGEMGRCVDGAIQNYTTQLLTYNTHSDCKLSDNLTEALLFLSHFIGDIHQPLHVGFTSDRGGNTIDIHWYTRKTVLHHAWDDNIIMTAEEQYYDSKVEEFIDAIQNNITSGWSDLVPKWEACGGNNTACPTVYASEGIKAACDWAYKGVTEDSILDDDYFESRLPIVKLRLAQAGVRLAATLNRIFQ
ncbi:Endonuclease 2 [Linum grandiflorum]